MLNLNKPFKEGYLERKPNLYKAVTTIRDQVIQGKLDSSSLDFMLKAEVSKTYPSRGESLLGVTSKRSTYPHLINDPELKKRGNQEIKSKGIHPENIYETAKALQTELVLPDSDFHKICFYRPFGGNLRDAYDILEGYCKDSEEASIFKSGYFLLDEDLTKRAKSDIETYFKDNAKSRQKIDAGKMVSQLYAGSLIGVRGLNKWKTIDSSIVYIPKRINGIKPKKVA